MFSDAKWSRYVGERARPGMDGPPPDELHVVPANFTHLQAPNYASLQDAPSIGWSVGAILDTPLAGYAVPTLQLVGPRDGGERIVGAAGANPDTRHFFHPGVFSYEGYWRRVGGATVNPQFRVVFLGARTTDPTNQANIEPLPGSMNNWQENASLPTAALYGGPLPFSGEVYVPRPWIICVLSIGVLVDTDIFDFHMRVLPVYLFDEAGAT